RALERWGREDGDRAAARSGVDRGRAELADPLDVLVFAGPAQAQRRERKQQETKRRRRAWSQGRRWKGEREPHGDSLASVGDLARASARFSTGDGQSAKGGAMLPT